MIAGVAIAIVDDDESVRKAIKRLVKSAGLSAEDFASAEEFLSSGRHQNSACLILDVRLPGMSGLELQSRLAASKRRIPIVFISAHGDGQMRDYALANGAIDFLQKPFSDEALLGAIAASIIIQRNEASVIPDENRAFLNLQE
jgi:FixJ family two-component response regulator